MTPLPNLFLLLQKSNTCHDNRNEVAGGGGSNGKEGPYYLCILLA